jgi:hypothetical protein
MIRFIFFPFFLMVLGCILLLVGPAQPVSAGMGGYEDAGSSPGKRLWPGGEVPVLISGSFTGDEHNTILQALNTWRDRTGYALEFTEISQEEICSSCQSYPLEDTCHCSPEDTCHCRYVHILTPEEFNPLSDDDPIFSGCNSWGPQTDGPTYTVLSAPDCINLPSIIHEIGHAIGLGHEQQRPDRDFYITFEDPFVPKSWEGNYQPDPWPDCTGPDPVVGFFDYDSYMHTATYHATPLSPDVIWPLRFFPSGGPSEGDIDTVRALYGFDIYHNSDIGGGAYAIFPLETNPDAVSRQQVGENDWACLLDSDHIVPTQRPCQLACAADVRCKAYTYVGIGLLDTQVQDYAENNVLPYCFLKDNVSTLSPVSVDTNIHSGVRRGGHPYSFGVAFNVDLFGGQISDGVVSMPHNVLNGNNCKDLCAQDPMCDAFTFVPGDVGTCYKKTFNPDPLEPSFTYQRHDGYMSGVIRGANDPVNFAPTSDAGEDYTQECAGGLTTLALDGTGSSDPEESSLTYFWTTDCPPFNQPWYDRTFDDATSPQPSLTASTSDSCSITCNVSLIVTDDHRFRSTRDSATVTIQDTTPPTLVNVPADETIECGAIIPPPAHDVSATDTCDTSVVPTFVETRIDGSCAANYTLERTWTAVDDCGNSNSATQTITVQDTTGPVIDCNTPWFISPPHAPLSFTATATDTCSDVTTTQITGFNCVGRKGNSKLKSCIVTYSGSTITIQDTGGVGTAINWTVQAIDSCGNITNGTCKTVVLVPF